MRKTEINKRREQIAIATQNILSSKYRVSICDFDKTALEVHCTEKQFCSICEEYGCSGTNTNLIDMQITDRRKFSACYFFRDLIKSSGEKK